MDKHRRRKVYTVAFTQTQRDIYNMVVEAGWSKEGFSQFAKRAIVEKAERMFIVTGRKKADIEGTFEA